MQTEAEYKLNGKWIPCDAKVEPQKKKDRRVVKDRRSRATDRQVEAT